MGRMEQECQKLKKASMNDNYENEEARFSLPWYIYTHYDMVINMEESVDAFAQLDTRT